MKMNIFLCKCNLFPEKAKKSIFLNYDVINELLGCLNKGKNDFTSSSPANPKLSENVCY